MQRYVATSMARLAPTGQLKSIFCDKNGLDILLDMLTAQPANGTAMRESAQALLELAKKVRGWCRCWSGSCLLRRGPVCVQQVLLELAKKGPGAGVQAGLMRVS